MKKIKTNSNVYYVIDEGVYCGELYYYMINANDATDIRICLVDGEKLKKVSGDIFRNIFNIFIDKYNMKYD